MGERPGRHIERTYSITNELDDIVRMGSFTVLLAFTDPYIQRSLEKQGAIYGAYKNELWRAVENDATDAEMTERLTILNYMRRCMEHEIIRRAAAAEPPRTAPIPSSIAYLSDLQ